MTKTFRFVLATTLMIHSQWVPLRASTKNVTILIQADQNLDLEYLSILRSRPEWKSWSEFQHRKSKDHDGNKKVQQLFFKAQESYLMGDFLKSETFFKKIANLRFSKLYDQPSIQIIQHSLIRLYELSNKDLTWLKKAADFQLNWLLDKEIFSPETRKEFHKIRLLKQIHISLANMARPQMIYRNGQPIKVSESELIQVPSNQARWDLFFNQRSSVHFVGNFNDIKKIESPNLGDCKNPTLNSLQNIGSDFKIFYGPQCIIDFGLGDESISKHSIANGLQSRDVQSIEKLAPIPPPEKKEIFYKKSWFWLALSGLAALSVLGSLKRKSQTNNSAAQKNPQRTVEGY